MRVMSEAQKKLRAWFRRKKWKTCNTPTNQGFYLLSPVRNDAGMLNKALDPETGQVREYSTEHRMGMELDRFTCDYVTIPVEDILKLAELIKVAQQEWLDSRPSKNHLNYMESIAFPAA